MNKSAELREMLNAEETLVMPDAYDPISARVIERSGFKAVQCSGYSISIAACLQAEEYLSLEENVEATRRITRSVSVPVMADGEDGYGPPDTVAGNVRQFIRAGAAGINLEDQIPTRGRECRIVDTSLMVEKITAARDAAAAEGNPELVINARTDSLRAFEHRGDGLKEAVERANTYLNAGADLAFVCYAATLDEVRTLAKEIHGPISIAAGMPYNIREFTIDDLRQLGIARVSLPVLAILSAVRALSASVSFASRFDGFSRIVDDQFYCAPEELSALLQS